MGSRPYSFGPILDSIESLLRTVAADGEALLSPDLDPFASVAQSQPLFKSWRDDLHTKTIASPDGNTKFFWFPIILREARAPMNKTNQEATDMTVQLLMTMAEAGLQKMHDPRAAVRDWLTSSEGKYSADKTQRFHAATVGAHSTNDRVESNFGGFDNVIRVFRTISVDAASGIAQNMRNHFFDSRERSVARNPRKAKAASPEVVLPSSVGFFDTLPAGVQEAAVEMGRQLRQAARSWERSDRLEQAEYREMKRAEKLQLQLEALAEQGAIIVERFAAFEVRACTVFEVARSKISAMSSVAAQVAYLREQIELRVLGCGWRDLAIPWKQGDERPADQVMRLLNHLKTVLQQEKGRTPPIEPPLPDFKAKTLKQLGAPTADSIELASRALCSPEQLRASIEREQQRRVEAGLADTVQASQPKEAPAMESLVGKRLEICWNYTSTEDNRTKVPIWCPCTVIKVANGSTDKGRDGQPLSRASRVLAPRGMVLVEWEPDPDREERQATQCWYLLHPNKWQGQRTERDKDTHKMWRFHPAELAKLPRSRKS